MKKFILATLAALTLAGCSSGPRYRDSHGRQQRYQMQQIRALADRLAYATEAVFRRAESLAGRVDRRERAALERLYRLDQTARWFRSEVSGGFSDPRDTRGDFDRLVRAYREAGQALRLLQGQRDLYRAFDDVGRSLERMAPFYGYDQNSYGWR